MNLLFLHDKNSRVILNGVKNLNAYTWCLQILRIAQADTAN